MFKYLLLLPFLLVHLLCEGQTNVLVKLRKADSLLHIEQLEEADFLLKQIEKVPQISTTAQLNLHYLRGYYYNISEENTLAAKALLKLPEIAQQEKQFGLAAEANLQLALVHEKTEDFTASKEHLNNAFYLIEKNKIDTLLGWYYVRLSSFYRQTGNKDSALYAAKMAIPYAKDFNHLHALADAYFLVGALLQSDPENSAFHSQQALRYYSLQHHNRGAFFMYGNLSKIYLSLGLIDKALLYNDSAIELATNKKIISSYYSWLHRSNIYEKKKYFDSALIYFKLYSEGLLKDIEKNEGKEIKKLTQQYALEKKDDLIRLNNQRLWVTIFITGLITIASILIYISNRKIKRQNQKINAQVIEVNKLLQHKQILLSELQHRVKNNLQHLLSLLDIQEESLAHNNIKEVIRETKNRVHSMALLHNKLTYTNEYEEVNFEDYLHELTSLIQNAYTNPKKQIHIAIDCKIKKLDIDTAIPLGLVLVELLSNSIKHAFIIKQTGTIFIKTLEENNSHKRLLIYGDDGCGFDFNHPPKQGLGLQLINGLISEINAILETKHKNGNEFTIRF